MGSEIDEGKGRRIAMRIKIARWAPVLGLLATLLVAGCANKDITSDSDKRGGLYGGVSAGGTRP
jgi:hypothetical protein